jgi:UrcA family protein
MNTHAFRKFSVLVVIFGLVSSAAGQEAARGDDGGQSRTVNTAGLDPARLTDAEVLYRRIRTAAHSVCRAQKAIWDGRKVLHQKRCVARAIEDALARADAPLLTTVHRAFDERLAER